MTDTTTRRADLRQILIGRRSELEDDVQNRIRGRRIDQADDGRDHVDVSDAHVQGDMEFALLQMRAEMLKRIGEALKRLEAGEYGSCADCDREITARRLRALPFAVRCQPCEERRENDLAAPRRLALRRGNFSLFPEAVSS